MDKKITKRENFEALRELLTNLVDDNTEQTRLLGFINHEIELLDKRAKLTRTTAQKNPKSEDALAEAIFNILQDGQPHDIPGLVKELNANNFEATPQKVTYRLAKMVVAGSVTRETISTHDKVAKTIRKVCMFTVVPNQVAEEVTTVEAEAETEE